MLILEVLTEYGSVALDRTFSYLYDGKKAVGPRFRVLIPFRTKTIVGFVMRVETTSLSEEELEKEKGYPLRKLCENDILDEEPLLSDALFVFAIKLKVYYL